MPGARLNSEPLQDNREQPGGDLFAGSHHGVIFARVMHRRRLAAPFHQFIGFAGHRRHHHGDVMAGIDLALDMPRDIADSVDTGDRRAAEFHHEAAHDAGAFPVRLSNVTRTQNGKRTNQKARIHSGAVSGKQPGSGDSGRHGTR